MSTGCATIRPLKCYVGLLRQQLLQAINSAGARRLLQCTSTIRSELIKVFQRFNPLQYKPAMPCRKWPKAENIVSSAVCALVDSALVVVGIVARLKTAMTPPGLIRRQPG